MEELARKKIADGEAILQIRFGKGLIGKKLYQVVINETGSNSTVVLPTDIANSTREKAQAIFDELDEQTTFSEIFARAVQEESEQ
jgi:hypothetical protein